MTPSRCISEPVSWLLLERFRLGELGQAEHARIAEHVAACAACAACAARIEADETLELSPLEVGSTRVRNALDAPRRPSPRGLRLLASVGALAAAAIAILAVGRTWRAPGGAAVERGEAARPKGDGMAFVLVRDDGQQLVEAQGVFRGGDRFKALVTCPPSMTATFDLVVFDASGASFPIAPARGLTCGNEVPLPGAFRLTQTAGGGTEIVCIVWGRDGLDRGALAQSEVVAGPRSMCKELHPAGD
jgi:hypothetical protein